MQTLIHQIQWLFCVFSRIKAWYSSQSFFLGSSKAYSVAKLSYKTHPKCTMWGHTTYLDTQLCDGDLNNSLNFKTQNPAQLCFPNNRAFPRLWIYIQSKYIQGLESVRSISTTFQIFYDLCKTLYSVTLCRTPNVLLYFTPQTYHKCKDMRCSYVNVKQSTISFSKHVSPFSSSLS